MTFKGVFVAVVAVSALGLTLAQKQAPLLKDAPKEVLFRVGKPLALDCAVESGDSGDVKSYQWFKDDVKVDPEADSRIEQVGGKLNIKESKHEDLGQYHCQATTSAGVASTRSISVKRAFLDAPKLETQRIKPVEGKPFKLASGVYSGYPRPTFIWKKVSKDCKGEEVKDGRITISPEGDLYFSNATEADVSTELKYVCVAQTPAVDGELAVAEYFVEGIEKNPKPDNEVVQQYVVPKDTTIKEGEATYLYCIYGGSPLAHPDWYKDGVNVNNSPGDRVTRYNRSKGKRLLIKEVLREDEGEYTCVINNGVGKEQNYTFKVSVNGAPKFLKKPEIRVQAKEGDDLFVPCEADLTKPGPQISWVHNAEPLVLNRRVVINNKGLTINKVQKSDAGYYGCTATNSLGEEYAETLIQVA